MKPTSIFDKLVFAVFLVLVASLAVQKPSVTAVLNRSVSATDLLFPISLLLTLAAFVINRKLPKWNRIYWFYALYLSAFLLSSLFATKSSSAFTKTFATAYLIGLAVLSTELIDSRRRLFFTIGAWLAGASIPILVGIVTLFVFYISPENSLLPYVTYHHGAVPIGNFPRLSSTFVSASMFCNYLTATVMLILAVRRTGLLPTWVWWTMFLLIGICSVFTVSAGLGAYILALTVWFYFTSESRARKAVGSLGLGLFGASLLATLIAFQPHSTAPYSYVVPVLNVEIYPSSRILVWTEALKTFANNFFFGSGPGTPSANVIYQNTSGEFSLLTDAHNTFLSIAAQTGIVGLIAITAVVIQLVRIGSQKSSLSRARLALAIAFVCAFLLQGLTGSFEDARHIWILMGMLVAAWGIESESEELAAEI